MLSGSFSAGMEFGETRSSFIEIAALVPAPERTSIGTGWPLGLKREALHRQRSSCNTGSPWIDFTSARCTTTPSGCWPIWGSAGFFLGEADMLLGGLGLRRLPEVSWPKAACLRNRVGEVDQPVGIARARTARRFASSPRRSYRAVVLASACPATFCTVKTSTPASSRWVTAVRRRS